MRRPLRWPWVCVVPALCGGGGCLFITHDDVRRHDLPFGAAGGTGASTTGTLQPDPDGNFSPASAEVFDGDIPTGSTTVLGSGVLGTPGDADFYAFDADADAVYFLRTVSDLPADPVLRIWDASSSLAEADELVFRVDPGDAGLYWQAPSSGTFYAEIVDWTATTDGADDAGDPGWTYDVAIGQVSVSETEPGNDARSLTLEAQRGGLVGGEVVEAVGVASTGNTDYYALSFDPSGSWRIAVETAGTPPNLALVDAFGAPLATAPADAAVYVAPDHVWTYPTVDAAILWQNASGSAAATLYLQVDGGQDGPYVVAGLPAKQEFVEESELSPSGECVGINADELAFDARTGAVGQLKYAGHVTADDSDVIKIPGSSLGGFLSVWAQSASVGYPGVSLTVSQGQVVGCTTVSTASTDPHGLGSDPAILDLPVTGWSDAWIRVDATGADAFYYLTIEQADAPRFQ